MLSDYYTPYLILIHLLKNAKKCLLLEFEVCSFSPEVNERKQRQLRQEVNFVEISFVVADNSVLFCLVIIVRISSGSCIIPGSALRNYNLDFTIDCKRVIIHATRNVYRAF